MYTRWLAKREYRMADVVIPKTGQDMCVRTQIPIGSPPHVAVHTLFEFGRLIVCHENGFCRFALP